MSLAVKPVGKPDARNGHVRFAERGWETGRRFGVSTRAHPRLYPEQGVGTRKDTEGTESVSPTECIERVGGL